MWGQVSRALITLVDTAESYDLPAVWFGGDCVEVDALADHVDLLTADHDGHFCFSSIRQCKADEERAVVLPWGNPGDASIGDDRTWFKRCVDELLRVKDPAAHKAFAVLTVGEANLVGKLVSACGVVAGELAQACSDSCGSVARAGHRCAVVPQSFEVVLWAVPVGLGCDGFIGC